MTQDNNFAVKIVVLCYNTRQQFITSYNTTAKLLSCVIAHILSLQDVILRSMFFLVFY